MLKFLIAGLFALQGFSSSWVDEGLGQESAFRYAVKGQILNWAKTLTAAPGNLTRVLEQLQWDLGVAKSVQGILNEQAREVTWSAKTNKLALILPAAIELLNRDGEKLMRGEIPDELAQYWDTPRINNAGNIRELALKAALYVALRPAWDDESAVIHSTPLPPNLPIYLGNWSFYQDGELAFVHGGYAFGGQRDDKRYVQKYGRFGKEFGPQDCSSWISKLINAPEAFSTIDFMAHEHPFLRKTLIEAPVDTLADIEPGMIWVTRKGGGGHIVLVLGIDECAGKVRVLEYGRDLPKLEGFGQRLVDFPPAAEMKSKFFKQAI